MRASVGPHTFLLMCMVAAGVVLADSPGLPVSVSTTAQTTAQLNGLYLRLDASNDPLTGALALANGSAAAPSLTWNAGGVNTGFFTASAGLTGWAAGGVQELTLSATGITPAATSGLNLGTSALPFGSLDVAAGTLALPALRMGDTNSGFVGGADQVQLSLNGVVNWLFATTASTSSVAVNPVANDTLDLGTASLGWNEVFVGTNIVGTGSAKALSIQDAEGVSVQSSAGSVTLSPTGRDWAFSSATFTGPKVIDASQPSGLQLPTSISIAPGAALACTAATAGRITYVDDTDDASAAFVCICHATSAGVYAYRNIADLTSVCP